MWLMEKKLSKLQQILKLLKQTGGATNFELSRISLNYTRRISDLRRNGHKILAIRQVHHDGSMANTWRYYLQDEPEDLRYKLEL